MRKAEPNITAAEMDAAREFADKDSDGKVSLDEFVKIMNYKPKS